LTVTATQAEHADARQRRRRVVLNGGVCRRRPVAGGVRETRDDRGSCNLGDAGPEMRASGRRTTRWCVAMRAGARAILFVAAGCVATRDEHDLDARGVEYRLQELERPRPNRVHILRVDLADGRIQPAVAIAADPDGDGPAEAALTDPFKLAGDRSVIAFVNTNPWDGLPDATGKRERRWFEGQPIVIHGLAASGGHVRSPAEPGGASVWIDARGSVFLGDVPGDTPIAEGMAGFQQIVREGAVVAPPGGPLHPRTAIGGDRTGSVMWLVVVDGRQKGYSEGMTLQELGGVMHNLGCWNATNMDGGGSSVMAMAGDDGSLRVVNSPSDRYLGVPKVRPLPMVLTIRQPSGPRPSAATEEALMKRCNGEP